MLILEKGEKRAVCECGRVELVVDGHGKSWINTQMNGSYSFVYPKKEKPRDEYLED